jgi:hypothetical protein
MLRRRTAYSIPREKAPADNRGFRVSARKARADGTCFGCARVLAEIVKDMLESEKW